MRLAKTIENFKNNFDKEHFGKTFDQGYDRIKGAIGKFVSETTTNHYLSLINGKDSQVSFKMALLDNMVI